MDVTKRNWADHQLLLFYMFISFYIHFSSHSIKFRTPLLFVFHYARFPFASLNAGGATFFIFAALALLGLDRGE